MKHIKLFEDFLNEGVHDPGILKAFFMAGGPGSGKSYVAGEIFGVPYGVPYQVTATTGLKMINSDPLFELELKKMGIDPKTLGDLPSDQFDTLTTGSDSPREKAKKLTAAKQNLYLNGRLGMVIDGTGDEFQKMRYKRNKLVELGYDTYMIFVNTSLNVAQERNAMRTRSLPEKFVKETWLAVQKNLGLFQKEFGTGNVIIVDNSANGQVNFSYIEKEINRLLRIPIQNQIGRAWIKDNS